MSGLADVTKLASRLCSLKITVAHAVICLSKQMKYGCIDMSCSVSTCIPGSNMLSLNFFFVELLLVYPQER